MTPRSPTVDIVIAAYNEEAMLGDCLESLLGQRYASDRVRICVVDNGSTDSTKEIASRYPVELVINPTPGAAAARNCGTSAGEAELVAFLDAHCVANADWIASMVEHFHDDRVGGCQGRTQLAARDERVALHIERTGMNQHDNLLASTLWADVNIYPWVLSGNCMFRRSVLTACGGFDESLPACEDVDLSWRVVLAGYLLEYAERASVVHWNCDSWELFVRKSRRQGRGAAVLAHRYLPLGALNVFEPVQITQDRERAEIARAYEEGYREEERRIAFEDDFKQPISTLSIAPERRGRFKWKPDEWLSVSTDAVYWRRGDSRSVIVHQPTRSRFVLDDSAHLIWGGIAAGKTRDLVAEEITNRYSIAMPSALKDCDDFVNELIDSGLLVRASR